MAKDVLLRVPLIPTPDTVAPFVIRRFRRHLPAVILPLLLATASVVPADAGRRDRAEAPPGQASQAAQGAATERGQEPRERSVTGVVIDADTQVPLPGAEVIVGGATQTTDATGRFRLRLAAGTADVTATAPGYFPLTTTVDVSKGDVDRLELALARDAGFSTSVAVVASAPTAAPAAETVQPVQVLRTPGALDNIYRTLQTLPGVAPTDEFGSRLSVRGGAPDQNLTMMDGVEVHDPFRLFGLTSAFNPETIQRFELATGGFSVKYGDRLSSLLVVENRDGRSGGMNGSASLSVTDTNTVFEGGLPGGQKGSWLVTGRRTYYDFVASRITGQDFPQFQDLQSKVTWAPSGGTRVSAFGMISRQAANVELDSDDARGEFQDDTDNDLSWLRLDQTIGTRAQSRTILGYSDTRSTLGVDAAFQNASRRSNSPAEEAVGLANVVFERSLGVKDVSLRQEFTVSAGTHLFEAGFEAHVLDTAQRFSVTGDRNESAANGSSVQGGAGLPDLLVASTSATRAGAWLQDTWQAGARVSLQGGLRLDRFGNTRETRLSPRLSATVAADERTRLLAAVGVYRQSPGDEKLAQSDYVLDFSATSMSRLRSEQVRQLSVGVERTLGAGITVKVEGYYKRFTDALIGQLEPEPVRAARVARYDFPADLQWSVPTSPFITTVPVNEGRGTAYGLDVYLSRLGGGRLTGWTSYTLGRAIREAYGRSYDFEYDRRHAFTMVSSYALTSRWDIAATTRIASGFPRTAPLGVRVLGAPDVLDMDGDGNIAELRPMRDEQGLLVYGVDYGGVENLGNARLPLFARVDARLTWRPRGAMGRWELYAEVINVLNRRNAGALDARLEYDPNSDRPAIVEDRDQALPRLPTVGVRFRF